MNKHHAYFQQRKNHPSFERKRAFVLEHRELWLCANGSVNEEGVTEVAKKAVALKIWTVTLSDTRFSIRNHIQEILGRPKA